MTTTITNEPPVIELTPDQMLTVMEMAGLTYFPAQRGTLAHMRRTEPDDSGVLRNAHILDDHNYLHLTRDEAIRKLFDCFLQGALYYSERANK